MILLVFLLLSACGTTDNSRYKDNANLEQPPELPIDKQGAEQVDVNKLEAPKRRHGKGLKSDIYMTEGSTTQFKIKRSFDEAWSILNRAIQHNDLKVTDQDRSKGFYYVAYNSGFFGKASTFFDGERKNQPTYLLKVEAQGDETSVIASLAGKDEQTNQASPKNAGGDTSQDQSPKLMELLFDTLHDDLKDE